MHPIKLTTLSVPMTINHVKLALGPAPSKEILAHLREMGAGAKDMARLCALNAQGPRLTAAMLLTVRREPLTSTMVNTLRRHFNLGR